MSTELRTELRGYLLDCAYLAAFGAALWYFILSVPL